MAHPLSQKIQAELDELGEGGAVLSSTRLSAPSIAQNSDASPITSVHGLGMSFGTSAQRVSGGHPAAAPNSFRDQNHSLVSSHSAVSSSRIPPQGQEGISPAPFRPTSAADNGGARLQQLLQEKLHQSLRGADSPYLGSSETPPVSLSFAAGGGAATFSSLSAQSKSSAGFGMGVRRKSVTPGGAADFPQPRSAAPSASAAAIAADELFELRKALLSATAASEQLKLALHAEKQKVVLLEHTLQLRDQELADAQRQLASDAAAAAADRLKALDAERHQHGKIVQLHADIERQAASLRAANQDHERARAVRQSLEQELADAASTVAQLSDENNLLRDCLKRRNIQYERLKGFITGPMRSFIDTAATFNGQWGLVNERQLPHAADDGVMDDCGASPPRAHIRLPTGPSNDEGVETRAALRLAPRLRPESLVSKDSGNYSLTAGPQTPGKEEPRTTRSATRNKHSVSSSSSSSSSSSDREKGVQDVPPEIHRQEKANSATRPSDDIAAAAEQSAYPSWTSSTRPPGLSSRLHHTDAATGFLAGPCVVGKALMPSTQSRIQRMYDPVANHDVMTDEELEKRVTALLSRSIGA
jgi:hypothetical protein